MSRPIVSRAATGTPGIRKVTRTYDDGRTVEKWEVRVKRDGALRLVGTFSTAKAADAARIRAVNDLENGDYVSRKVRKTPFLEVAEHWLAHHPGTWKPRTLATNTDIVKRRLAPLHALPIGQVTYEQVMRQLSAWTNDGLAYGTRKRSYAVLKAVLADAVRRDLLARNPCDKVTWKDETAPAKARLTIPSSEDVERLISSLDEPWSLLVELAAYTGLRAGEIAGLQKRHVNTALRTVRVEQTVVDLDGSLSLGKPKSNAGYRDVGDLDPNLCQRLAAHLAGKRSNDYVFGGQDDASKPRPHSHRNFTKRVFQPACATLGLSMRFHDLRHFNASVLFDEGLMPLEVAARLGHHDGAFTLRTYGHLFSREDAGLGGRIAARRAAARKATGNVVPLRAAAAS